MKIAVIAANGRSGRAFVETALHRGHQVRAGIHSHNPFRDQEGLTVLPCDATKLNDVKKLLKDCDAIVSLVGHVKGSAPDTQTVAITQVIAAMQTSPCKRLVSLTGTGVRFPGDQITILDRFLNLGVSIIDPARVHDGKKHVAALQSSNLDWTVLRVLKLQNVPSHPFTLRAHGPTKPYVGRTEVAHAILEILEKESFIHEAPIISK